MFAARNSPVRPTIPSEGTRSTQHQEGRRAVGFLDHGSRQLSFGDETVDDPFGRALAGVCDDDAARLEFQHMVGIERPGVDGARRQIVRALFPRVELPVDATLPVRTDAAEVHGWSVFCFASRIASSRAPRMFPENTSDART